MESKPLKKVIHIAAAPHSAARRGDWLAVLGLGLLGAVCERK